MNAARTRFRVVTDRSAVLIEARSNVGPITFGSTAVVGFVEAEIDGDAVETASLPSAQLSVDLSSLRSGNRLYDAELLRRVDARHHPTTTVELREAVRIGNTNRYQVTGDLTFHGVSRTTSGTVAVSLPGSGKIQVVGEHQFDIRDFDIVAPSVLMLRIYPDVHVQLQLEAEPDALDDGGG